MLFLLAEESLHPLAVGSGHAERYHPDELIGLIKRATVFVAESHGEIAGWVAVEREDDALVVRCLCIGPGFEARGVSHRLIDWVEGLAFNEHRSRLRAVVPQSDQPSRHVYGEHEFVPRPVADRPETVVMEKRLPVA
jgi:N-acetylglutamate synthase-like GNAT family acetyltransferase